MATRLARAVSSTSLLSRMLHAPDLVRVVRELPPRSFAALIRQVGVEDAGELVALASAPQLVAAFDEDLFVNTRPGERETFDARRFLVWLEVLLEAGDSVVARRVSELSEDFVVHALSRLMLVLDNDALFARMSEVDDETLLVDKKLENCPSEELEGYLLLSRVHDGWDAVWGLVQALDREERELLERLLDRCAYVGNHYLDDLAALHGVLDEAEALADEVEGEREARRSQQGFVDPRAARNFLTLAREPLPRGASHAERDPVTHAHFRDLDRHAAVAPPATSRGSGVAGLLGEIEAVTGEPVASLSAPEGPDATDAGDASVLAAAMAELHDADPTACDARMDELAFLANVLLAAGELQGRRLGPAESAHAALATVMLGAELEAAEHRQHNEAGRARQSDLVWVLRACTADALFRKASHALSSLASSPGPTGGADSTGSKKSKTSSCVVFEPADVTGALGRLRGQGPPSGP